MQGRPAGRPDPRPARQAAQRAQHLLHAAGAVLDAEQPLRLHLEPPHNWLVLVLLMLAGALIRQFFVLRHGCKLGRNRACRWALCAGRHAGAIVARGRLAAARRPQRGGRRGAGRRAIGEVQKVLEQRCSMCHGAQVQKKNVALDTPEADQAARAGGLPAGGGDQAHADEQCHRHHRAERALIGAGSRAAPVPLNRLMSLVRAELLASARARTRRTRPPTPLWPTLGSAAAECSSWETCPIFRWQVAADVH